MIIVEKPWGYEKWVAHCPEYVLKEIFIKKGTKTSLQYHKKKKETLYFFNGKIQLTVDDYTVTANAGSIVELLPEQIHQICALEDSLLFEVSTYHLEDVVRLKDDYGRAENANT